MKPGEREHKLGRPIKTETPGEAQTSSPGTANACLGNPFHLAPQG